MAKFDWGKAWRHGEELAADRVRFGDPIDERAIMFALLEEAAKATARCYKGPPFSGFPSKSAMPESSDEVTSWQMVSAFIRGEIEKQDIQTKSKPAMPDSATITRAEHVLDLYHRNALIHTGAWSEKRRAVYMKACGCPVDLIGKVTGMRKQQIHYARRVAMDDMYDALKRLTYLPIHGMNLDNIEDVAPN